jgi:hypothetical protein
MTQRLTLSPTGIKSPLDVGTSPAEAETPPPPAAAQATEQPARAPTRRAAARKPKAQTPPPSASATASEETKGTEGTAARFYGGGYPIQTSIALDVQLLEQAMELAWAAAVSFTTLIVATLQAGLPTTAEQAVKLAVLERADHPATRIERNIRLPRQLRARLDELAGAHARAARVTRADLVNALMRQHLPDTAEAAAALCAAYTRQQALANIQAA